MKQFLKRLALGILLALPWIGAVSAQQVNVYCQTGTGTGPSSFLPASAANPCPVSATVSASITFPTIGAAVPSTGVYNALNVAGTLRGWSGLSTGSLFPGAVAVVDASGNQITSFGGANASVGATGSAVPASATYVGIISGGNLIGWTGAVTQGTAANLNATVVGTGTFAAQVNAFTSWAGGTLGAMANYGTSPGAVLVPGTNAFVTNTVTVTGSGGTFPITGATSNASSAVATSSTNVPSVAYNYGFNGTTWDQLQVDGSKFLKTVISAALPAGSNAIGTVAVPTWAGGTLGAMANYGTSPGAVLVPGVNSFVTNTVTVTGAGGTFPITGATSNASSAVATSSTNVPAVAYNYVFNGTTWDQKPGTAANGEYVQGAVAGGSADSGNPVKTGGKYSATRPTYSDGQRTDLQSDTKGNLAVGIFAPQSGTAVSTAVPGDGASNAINPLGVFSFGAVYNGSTWDRMRGTAGNGVYTSPGGFSFANITTDTTTTVKSGAGSLHTICVNTPAATETIQIYDNTAGSGTTIGKITVFAATNPCFTYDVAFSTGLTIVTATAASDITVSYR